METNNYLIKSQNNFFVKVLSILSRDDPKTKLSISVLLGGIKKGCISININPIIKKGDFAYLEYSEKCSINGRLKKGDGTIDMLNTILSFIKNNYFPHQINTVVFVDDSHIFNNFGKKIWLYLAYYLIHGKTWYEAKFSAIPLQENDKLTYDSNKTKLQNPIRMDWNTFSSFLPKNIIDIEIIKSKFDNAIRSGDSWQELIHDFGQDFIFNTIGDKLPMLFFYQLNLYFPKYWKIDLNTFKPTDYIITEINDNFVDSIQIIEQ